MLTPDENTNAGPVLVGEVTAFVCVGDVTPPAGLEEKLKPVANAPGVCCGDPKAPTEAAGELIACSC